MNVIKRDVKD